MIATLFASRSGIEFAVLLLAVLLCWRWGAGPERSCASVLLYMKFIAFPYHWLVPEPAMLGSVDIGHFFIDASTAAALYVVAMRANRMYPMWLVALQLIAVVSHSIRQLSETIAPLAYAIMVAAPFYVQIAILLGGFLAHRRRSGIHGDYPSWRTG